MKRTTLITVSIMLAAASLMAQRSSGGYGRGMNPQMHQKFQMMGMMGADHKCMIPDLTDQQKEKIEALRTSFMKEAMAVKNLIAEKQAKLNTLRTADKPNMSEINKIIEDIGSLRTKMMKMGESHRQKVRALLTDEQKVIFDKRHMSMKKGSGCRKGHGRRR